MKLKLTKPLVCFDLETTGLDIMHSRVVEISMVRIDPDGTETTRTLRINPEMPIPPETTNVHGITDEDVKDCPTFKQASPKIIEFIQGCDLCGFNSNRFDVPLLAEELLRAQINLDEIKFSEAKFIDVQVIYHKLEKRNLAAAYKFYCDKDLENAHTAEADTLATYEVLKGQLDRYPELENDIDFLSTYSSHNMNVDFAGRMVYNDNNVPIFNFGKYKNQPVYEVLSINPGYYSWFMKSDFPLNTKELLTKIKIEGVNFGQKRAAKKRAEKKNVEKKPTSSIEKPQQPDLFSL